MGRAIRNVVDATSRVSALGQRRGWRHWPGRLPASRTGGTCRADRRARRQADRATCRADQRTSSDGRGHVQIATGLGAEGFLTDATVGAIQDEAVPLFQQRDYGRAIELMTTRSSGVQLA